MNHLSEEQVMQAYYDELDPKLREHLKDCPECRASFDRLKDVLDSVREYPVPERGASYGGEVWTRLLPHLPPARPRASWLRWWLIPALASLVAAAFVAGMLTQQQRQMTGISAKARERVLLISMSDHLEQSQIVLAELVNGTPEEIDLVDERGRARDLLAENRLLRQTAARAGDMPQAALLDELERVLTDIANSPSNMPPQDLEALQHRIESEGLLFKVRITSTDVREKGQKL